MSYGKSPFETENSSTQRKASTDGAFDIAIGPWMVARARQLYPELETNVRSTVRGVVGGEFSDRDLDNLSDRALKAAEYTDIPALTGIEAGVPVQLDASQARTIDRIVSKLGEDELGRRAQGAYRKARASGKIRVR